MSEELLRPDNSLRRLTDAEKGVLSALLQHAPQKNYDLSDMVVEDMRDGAMGSIRFSTGIHKDKRVIGRSLVEAHYQDSDGVIVSISLNIDSKGQLYELDFWKVDFAPIRQYPKPEQLRFETTSLKS